MPNVIANIPNFVSGVSQQPRTMRFPSQAEESINTYPSVVEGLTKRPPTQHIKRLLTPATQASSNSSSHFIDRSDTEKYVTEIREGKIRVWDLAGNEKTIYYGSGSPSTTPPASASSYLTGSTDDFKMLTIADYTFVLNKTAYPRLTSDVISNTLYGSYSTSKNRRQKIAFVTIKQFAEKSSMKIRIDCKTSAGATRSIFYTHESFTYVTSLGENIGVDSKVILERSDGGASPSQIFYSTYDMHTNITNSESIINGFRNWMSLGQPFYASSSGTGSTTTGTARSLEYITDLDGWQFVVSGSTLMIWNTKTGTANSNQYDENGDLRWGISVSDSAGGAFLNLNWEEVQSFADLPKHGTQNATFKIIGYPQDTGDEYWVDFRVNGNPSPITSKKTWNFTSPLVSTAGEGLWRETMARGQYYHIEPTTMPWALIRLSSGNFAFTPLDGVSRSWGGITYQPPNWADRLCGDLTQQKLPSFLNGPTESTKRINDIFFYKNRLGFLSEENIIFSEAGEYFNFFRTTITQTLDSDPIDIASNSVNVSNLNYAVPFFDRLLLFSENSQFSLVGTDNLTPKTASIQITTNFSAIPEVAPVGSGKNVYFPYYKDSYSGIKEYFLNPENGYMDANEITLNIPKYIEGKISKITASDTENILAVLTKKSFGDPEINNVLYIYKYLNVGSERVQGAWSKFLFGPTDRILNVFFKKENLYILIERKNDSYSLYLEKIDFQSFQAKAYLPYTPRLDRLITIWPDSSYNPTGTTTTYSSTTNTTAITLPCNYSSQVPNAVAGSAPEIDSSIKFSGNGESYLYSSNSADFYRSTLTNEYTISGFFKPTSLSNQIIFELDKGINENWKSIQLGIFNSKLILYSKTSSNTGTSISTTNNVILNAWNFFTIQRQTSSGGIYLRLNGGTPGFAYTSFDYYLNIGSANYSDFSGKIDNLAIINKYAGDSLVDNTYYTKYGPTMTSLATSESYLTAMKYSQESKNMQYHKLLMDFDSNLISYFTFDEENPKLLSDIKSKLVVFDKQKNISVTSDQILYTKGVFDEIRILSSTTSGSSTTITIEGSLNSYSGPIHIGLPYPMIHTITPVALRAPGQKGGQILVSSGNYQLKYGYLSYTNSKNFSIAVTSGDLAQGNSYNYNYKNNGSLKSGTFRFPLFLKSDNCFITLLNNTHYPCCFVSADFEGTLTNSYQRA
jgi:hypothetical protein